jgi:DNA-directed RNA polymerase subunit beta'
LKSHECGLPREMALELYQYLLIRQMLLKRQVSSVILAKRVIREQKDFVWDTLRELIYHHPLLLNRAPTLHRLGIQAFQPKLVLGSTILLHPLVCAGFNADFDGDQMGVHLPLCDEARAEAWDLLWSRNNLLSPATGEPILLPSQDMVLGFYHMTALLPFRYAHSTAPFTNRRFVQAGSDRSIAQGADKACRRGGFGFVQIDARLPQIQKSVLFEKGFRKSHFYSPLDVVRAYQNGDLDIHTPIWLQWNGKIENNDSGQIPLEVRINSFGVSTQLYPSYKYRKDATSKLTATFNLFIRTTPGRVIVNHIF